MAAKIIDGKKWAGVIQEEIRVEVAELAPRFRPPGLGVVLAGDHPASRIYVSRKEQACEAAGIRSVEAHLPADTSTLAVLREVQKFNEDPAIDGILVQLPLPMGVDEKRVLMAVDPSKDVDGFHPENVGLLSQGNPRFVPCTPAGVMELLKRENIPLVGRHAVVVGRSNIVGKPMGMLLLAQHATVTTCHSRTERLQVVCHSADILVAAIGKAGFIPGAWIRPGAVVIDVGINRIEPEGGGKAKIAGDVVFEEASRKAAWITPVPGGVGPMTIAMLLRNTLESAKRRSQP
ncbi:MAG: bifunctional methylenetetrahydrofolate dehydrogenase/methenyltetrahydrofolate cyclohydrolase FolD [Candidatus Omnitrophica bacterium]|nr:bifunctional methylenetetrahydrofolate dehydrogenase/methenyltetrahydrofolate cyclohydrolase FolD [bacterium]MBK7494601.1 bifunctional methylenetetrahydrofolate dehydrogenase/methenyltetrahydrofolate cyclohydrolase FolD [Candidatus Omnitrophota bacterium]MCE7907350.1 bifunctional methylenetetrahydrofolate dehydrogenase/methenyltetrahydrofolate cyclohydrolase FolD [Candidatus Omnitrophica bacterium COP1]MBV6480880.1 Bifunctional protein FolD protein [bacterium]MBW7937406.1 bifunctional methyl